MNIVHLTASPFFGGPERQMLGLARQMRPLDRSVFLSFAEGGKCLPFLEQCRKHDLETITLRHNHPRVLRCVREVAGILRQLNAQVLLCHGYKADVVGLLAARRAGIPVVGVSRGWTWATWKVRRYEQLDRIALRWMDRVACVSQSQAQRVSRAGVADEKIAVIHNSIDVSRFKTTDPSARRELYGLFSTPPTHVVYAAGRLSPEKGFDDFARAAAIVAAARPSIGFVLFGDGPLRGAIEQQVRASGLNGSFVFAGFRQDVDRLIPHADLMVLPSHTEGLPNVALEALAAGVPVVATSVGGTPEVVDDGISGFLTPPRDPDALAARILQVLNSERDRREMGQRGRDRVRERFTFEAQAAAYRQLLRELTGESAAAHAAAPASARIVRAAP